MLGSLSLLTSLFFVFFASDLVLLGPPSCFWRVEVDPFGDSCARKALEPGALVQPAELLGGRS